MNVVGLFVADGEIHIEHAEHEDIQDAAQGF